MIDGARRKRKSLIALCSTIAYAANFKSSIVAIAPMKKITYPIAAIILLNRFYLRFVESHVCQYVNNKYQQRQL